MSTYQHQVDARGLACPLPILNLRRAIKGADHGDVLQVLTTDAGSVKDVEAFCRQTGNELLESDQDGSEYTYLVKKV